MKYVLVSTYPREGSQNIGDKLIETATEAAVRDVDPEAQITAVWRAEEWDDVRDTISGADHVIFACLAIRARMEAVYPYLQKILDRGISYSALSAGASLKPGSRDVFNAGFGPADLDLLRRFAEAAHVFTTRGALTHAFCLSHDLPGVMFSGDVAFRDLRFAERRFELQGEIRSIVISDPHHGSVYVPVFRKLVSVLSGLFPRARIECALHGVNPAIEKAAGQLGLTVHPLYRDPYRGLDLYDGFQLHAGFRVHGHVAALQRRIPSYLVEQDGRGIDYGITLGPKISVPCYRTHQVFGTDEEKMDRLRQGQQITRHFAPPAAAEILGALIAQDVASGFEKFLSLERTIAGFDRRTEEAVRRICAANGG